MTLISKTWLNKEGPIIRYSFNADKSQIAVADGTNAVKIYFVHDSAWDLLYTFRDHEQVVTDVDWAPKSNRIVTCSQDRNTFVYTFIENEWRPSLVILRSPKSGTCVKWSPNEDKIAVGTAANIVAVCFYEAENDWWISKHLRKPFEGTITAVAWHPNNILLAMGGIDKKARVISAYIKEIDSKSSQSVWGNKIPFSTLCGEYKADGWIHDVAFSPEGSKLAYVSHDSTITFICPKSRAEDQQLLFDGSNTQVDYIYRYKLTDLPYKSLVWLDEDNVVAAGHNCHPVLFQGKETGWKQVKSIDQNVSAQITDKAKLSDDEEKMSFRLVRDTFRNMDLKGSSESWTLNTVHQNTVNEIKPHKQIANKITQISTGGADGSIAIWSIN